jgi:hypothetical protein
LFDPRAQFLKGGFLDCSWQSGKAGARTMAEKEILRSRRNIPQSCLLMDVASRKRFQVSQRFTMHSLWPVPGNTHFFKDGLQPMF